MFQYCCQAGPSDVVSAGREVCRRASDSGLALAASNSSLSGSQRDREHFADVSDTLEVAIWLEQSGFYPVV